MIYRVGTSVGKNIYVQLGDKPSKKDIDVGRMDDEQQAKNIVELANIGLVECEIRGIDINDYNGHNKEDNMKYVKIRICEWTALLPSEKDKTTQLNVANGHTYVEMEDDEKLTEVEAMPTGKTGRVPVEKADGTKTTMSLTTYAFRATIVKAVEEAEVLGHAEEEEKTEAAAPGHHVVLPGQPNRAERRAGKGYLPSGK